MVFSRTLNFTSDRKTIKPILAVDLDDVVFSFCNPFLDYLAERGIKMTRTDIEGSFTESGIPPRLINDFQRNAFLGLQPNALWALRQLYVRYQIIAVTARPLECAPLVFAMIQRHCAREVAGILFSQDKGELCRTIDAKYLIEDQMRYARQFEHTLVLAQEWNRGWMGWRGTWQEIVKKLIDNTAE